MKITPRPAPAEEICLAKVYVWELPVRLTHWLIATSIAVLAVTGFFIGNPSLVSPGQAGNQFVMGYTRLVHFYAAIVFTLSVLARITWMFVGNKYSAWDKFIPARRVRRKGLLPTFKFYSFLLRKPPGFVGHNPLAGLTYCFVFLLYLGTICTGLAMYSASAHVDSPLRFFSFLIPIFGGLQSARWIHHVIMWLLLGFAAHHVYSAVLMSTIEANATIESIFSGFKYVPREDLIFSGYRFVDRHTERGG